MKKFIFLFIACGLQLAVFSQSDKFVDAMKKNFVIYDSAKTAADFIASANTFERIGDAEKTQWLPYYYAGLALSRAGWLPAVTDKDANSGKINALMDKAEADATGDSVALSEIATIRNMAATQQMQVDPQTRWMVYGKLASDLLEKGLKYYPNNPRIYYLQAMSLFFTPVQFGGGKDKAKVLFEKSVALSKIESPKPLYPKWGGAESEQMLPKCQ